MKTQIKFENGTSLSGLGIKSHLSSLISHLLPLVVLSLVFAACEDEIIINKVPQEKSVETVVSGKLIYSAEDLAKIGVDADYPLTGDYFLAADIDMADYPEWTPIGSEYGPFTGVFDGNDKTIKNFTLAGGTNKYAGLFGNVRRSEIKNLNIELANSLDKAIISSNDYTGVLAASVIKTTIKNINIYPKEDVSNPGVLIISSCEPASLVCYIGGVIGSMSGSEISDSTSSVNIELDSTIVSDNSSMIPLYYIGGITGATSNLSRISGCISEGGIEATGRGIIAGGIVGNTQSAYDTSMQAPDGPLVKDCESRVSKIIVRCTTNQDDFMWTSAYSGGIAGSCGDVAGFRLENCRLTSAAEIQSILSGSGLGRYQVYAGGITGYGSTDNSYVSGAARITAKSYSAMSDIGAGGITGYGGGNKLYAGKGVTVTVKRYGSGTTGAMYTGAGGIAGVGSAANSYSFADVVLINSAPVAEVSETNKNAGYVPAAGGLVGAAWSLGVGAWNSNYAAGSVTVKNTNPSTRIYAGGIVGFTHLQINSCLALLSKIEVTSNGPVTEAKTIDGKLYYLPVANRINGSVTSVGFAACFASKEMQVIVNGVERTDFQNNLAGNNGDTLENYTDGGPLTQEFLTDTIGTQGGGDPEDYIWDFDTVWKWDEELGLPVLQ